jgi:energy-converting hydrogenase Eha subunit H
MTTEELEVRVWAFVVMILALILFGSVAMILYSVTFVDQTVGEIAEIDKQYLAILKDIMLLCIGAIGGIAGRKGAYAAANLMKGEKDDGQTN